MLAIEAKRQSQAKKKGKTKSWISKSEKNVEKKIHRNKMCIE